MTRKIEKGEVEKKIDGGREILVLPALLYNRVLCRNVFLTHILCLALPEGGFLAILLFGKNKCVFSIVCLGGIMLSAATPGVVVVNKRGIFFGLPKKGRKQLMRTPDPF
jgi:hypothetical protein